MNSKDNSPSNYMNYDYEKIEEEEVSYVAQPEDEDFNDDIYYTQTSKYNTLE